MTRQVTKVNAKRPRRTEHNVESPKGDKPVKSERPGVWVKEQDDVRITTKVKRLDKQFITHQILMVIHCYSKSNWNNLQKENEGRAITKKL